MASCMSSGPSTRIDEDTLESLVKQCQPFDHRDHETVSMVTDRIADPRVIGIAESAHGVKEFKAIPVELCKSLIERHGIRLVMLEATLGNLQAVDEYVAGRRGDLAEAMEEMRFWFWKTDKIKALFEWIRVFNAERTDEDRVRVHGFDAQFHDASARAIESYLRQVDREYLSELGDELDTLTSPLYHTSQPSFATPDQLETIERLESRLADHEAAYIAESSRSAWELAKRHVWTLERGLLFLDELFDEAYASGKEIRDPAMAENVQWLLEWTRVDRGVILGHTNHLLSGYGHEDQRGSRLGRELTHALGNQYYALGMRFGEGASTERVGESFEVVDLEGPEPGTFESVLAEVGEEACFLDLTQLDEPAESFIGDIDYQQRANDSGVSVVDDPPQEVMDGVLYVEEVTPASFFGISTDGA